jgi:outer membrane protein assembly factor BamA
MLALLVLAALVSGAASFPPAIQKTETLAEIRVHGNVVTTDEEIKRLAGVEVGTAVTPGMVDEVAARLRDAHRFQHVDVLKRFASIADPSQIVLVIVVDEGPVQIEITGDADSPTRVVKRRGPNLLYFPILEAEDGYGVTYGLRLAVADRIGKQSRLSFPFSWGGEKQAGAELDKTLGRGPLSRVVGGASLSRRTNPLYQEDADRARVWVRGERQLAHALRAGVEGSWQHVSFAGSGDRLAQIGADVVLDTRVDPVLPRNAVYARAAIAQLGFASVGAITRTQVDARAYVGLLGQTVLAVRATREAADGSLPAYEKLLLGGMANLRGFRAGTAAGDTLAAASAELLVPLTSPLHVGRIGVSAFLDAGTVYDHVERFADQPVKRGAGGSIWFSAAFLRLSVAVAHGIGSSTRVHVGGTVMF